jgi:hypothetical protein
MDEQFSPHQSLQVIQSMIDKAKQNLQNNSFYFLMWGWLVFIAALLHFFLLYYAGYKYAYLAWNLMWIGVVATIVNAVRRDKKPHVKTFIDEAMSYFGISLAIIYSGLAFFFGKLDLWQYCYPLYILVYAAACFFMGALMQFSFLKWAGILCLPLMVTSLFVEARWQLPLMALAVLIAYIIPGHILHARYKHQNS